MEVKDWYTATSKRCKVLYEERELNNILTILLEDTITVFNTMSSKILTEKEIDYLEECVVRLEKMEPIQYITGMADFYGLKFHVNKNVLIPRPETEELVAMVLTDLTNTKRQLDIVDVGTGSGCIGLTLKKKNPSLRVFGIETSLDALNVTKINAKNLQANIDLFKFDFLDQGYWNHLGKFDIIVSNPPYIPYEEIEKVGLSTLQYEPELALFVENDNPLIFYKKIAMFGELHLQQNGVIYAEVNEYNALDVHTMFQEKYKHVSLSKDMQSKDRIVKASHPFILQG